MAPNKIKKNVELSTYCWIISALSTALICGVFVYALKRHDNEWAVCILGGAIVFLFLFTLCYMPLSISLDNESLNINRPLKIKSIPLTEIEEAKLCAPTMGTIRICGSGGWFGWYGWFKEKYLGKYFAYYGKASDCFLVTLKDGKKYMLGCKDAPEMVKAINERLSASL
ncbi:PH domain-containing protein [Muribaculum intestinale]|uniref:PH domain-containing protein n=2 Tax=Muribaculaceae TaxID=2005473 RepID=UPI0025B6759F|nr:PH domain-containing protein [Muribaculum intestinale]